MHKVYISRYLHKYIYTLYVYILDMFRVSSTRLQEYSMCVRIWYNYIILLGGGTRSRLHYRGINFMALCVCSCVSFPCVAWLRCSSRYMHGRCRCLVVAEVSRFALCTVRPRPGGIKRIGIHSVSSGVSLRLCVIGIIVFAVWGLGSVLLYSYLYGSGVSRAVLSVPSVVYRCVAVPIFCYVWLPVSVVV